jgi:hypothetical protein
MHYPKRTPFVFLILGAILGFLFQVGYDSVTTSPEEQKIIDLSKKFDGFVQFAKKLYPEEEESEAINRLRKDFERFKSEYDLEKRTIKNLKSVIEIQFSGKWSESPGSIIPFSPSDRYWFLVLISSEHEKKIKFFGTQSISFQDLSPSTALFRSRQAVRQEEFPIGERIDVLTSFTKIRFFIPLFFIQTSIEGRKIFLEQVKVIFFLNDLELTELVKKPKDPFGVPINEKG